MIRAADSGAGVSGLWAVVPMKTLDAAKGRLAPVLTPVQRATLALAMLSDVLHALVPVSDIRGVLVISADPVVLALARATGARCVSQVADIGHTPSVEQAAFLAMRDFGADGLMVVPGDVPWATQRDFEKVVAAHRGAGCTLVPSWDAGGSNCLIVSPPTALQFRFGPDSFQRHMEAGRTHGLSMHALANANLAQDVDTPDDLHRWPASRSGRHTRQWLGENIAVAAAHDAAWR